MYHGIPSERAELRRTVMAPPGTRLRRSKHAKSKSAKSKSSSKSKSRKSSAKDSDDDDDEGEDEEGRTLNTFPVVITTYEMIIKDRAALAPYQWGYIVVDEGHRLKNLDCKLMREIKKYQSAGRLILTGTPLQVINQSSFFLRGNH